MFNEVSGRNGAHLSTLALIDPQGEAGAYEPLAENFFDIFNL